MHVRPHQACLGGRMWQPAARRVLAGAFFPLSPFVAHVRRPMSEKPTDEIQLDLSQI